MSGLVLGRSGRCSAESFDRGELLSCEDAAFVAAEDLRVVQPGTGRSRDHFAILVSQNAVTQADGRGDHDMTTFSLGLDSRRFWGERCERYHPDGRSREALPLRCRDRASM